MANAEKNAEIEQEDWQRLSPVSMVFFFIKFTISWFKQGLLNVLPAIAAVAVFADNKVFWLSILVPALILWMLVFSFLYYWFFRFRAGKGEISIHRGVFNKEHLNLQYARVQNVNIGTPFYFAPFKLVNCIIESAGSKSTEVDLPGVRKAFADGLRRHVFETGQTSEDDAKDAEDSNWAEPSGLVLKLSNWESAKYGLTSYLAFVVLAALAPFIEPLSSSIAGDVFPRLVYSVEPIVGNAFIAGALVAVGSASVFFLLMTMGSVAGALVRFYNYELYDGKDKLVRVAGLLERKSTTLTKQKIQSVWWQQNLMARLLNRVSLQYHQVGDRQDKVNESGIRIPMLMPEDSIQYTSLVFDQCPEPEFSAVHPSFVGRVFFYYWVVPFVAVLAVPVLFLSKFFLLTFLVLVPIFFLVRLRYRRYGFWFNDTYGAIRQGLFGQSVVVFPLYKVQIAEARQSRGQRRRKVGNLRIQLGSGKLSIPYLPMKDLNRFVDQTLYQVERYTQAWM